MRNVCPECGWPQHPKQIPPDDWDWPKSIGCTLFHSGADIAALVSKSRFVGETIPLPHNAKNIDWDALIPGYPETASQQQKEFLAKIDEFLDSIS